jgi:hypothetical protein
MSRRTRVAFVTGLLLLAGSWSGSRFVVDAQTATRGASDRRLVPTEIQGRIANPASLPPGLDPAAR